MRPTSEERWLLPRRQTEYPAKELVPETTLHRRRETTFFVLAAMVLIATAALVAGSGVMIDVQTAISHVAPDRALPTALVVPVGALPSALGVLALVLAFELYGRRRAGAIVWAVLFAAGAFAGVAYVAGLVDRQDQSFAQELPLAACAVVTAFAAMIVYAALRRLAPGALIVRAIVSTVFAQAAGWAAFAGVAHALAPDAAVDFPLAIALGSSAFVVASVIVIAPVFAIAARSLSMFLRVPRASADDDDDDAYVSGPLPRLQPAVILDEDEDDDEQRPYSSGEMRFFSEGDDTSLLAD